MSNDSLLLCNLDQSSTFLLLKEFISSGAKIKQLLPQ